MVSYRHAENRAGCRGWDVLPCSQSRERPGRGISQGRRLCRLFETFAAGHGAAADEDLGLLPDAQSFSSGPLAA